MADSLEYILTCQICLEEFEETSDHVPRILPCSHSLCEKCLDQLIHRNFIEQEHFVKCPECREKHRVVNDVKTFPQNKYILAYIRRKEAENIKSEQELNTVTCEKHGKEMTLYCKNPECSTIICQTCLTRHHRGHDVVEIEEVEREALLGRITTVTSRLQERKENILEARVEIQNKNRECKNKITARKDQLIQVINERCDQLLAGMSEHIDGSDELLNIWDYSVLLDNMKENMDKETISREEIKDNKETINSIEKSIQDYSLSLPDCRFYEFEENENTDDVRNLTTEEIIDDMYCVEQESKSLLVTVSGIEGAKAYNTRKPDLEWSVVGRLTKMEEAVDAQSITVDRNGRLFVCDIGNHCIHTFTMDGKYLSTMIKEGQQGLGELRRIRWSEDLSGLIVTHRKDNDTWISLIKI